LETYRFEKQARNFPHQDFPWQYLFPNPGADPITDIVEPNPAVLCSLLPKLPNSIVY
jgi:hypothetical protein